MHRAAQGAGELERLAPMARQWEQQVRAAFVGSYFESTQAGGLFAGTAGLALAQQLLPLFELELVLRQLRVEIDSTPEDGALPPTAMAALATLAGMAD